MSVPYIKFYVWQDDYTVKAYLLWTELTIDLYSPFQFMNFQAIYPLFPAVLISLHFFSNLFVQETNLISIIKLYLKENEQKGFTCNRKKKKKKYPFLLQKKRKDCQSDYLVSLFAKKLQEILKYISKCPEALS